MFDKKNCVFFLQTWNNLDQKRRYFKYSNLYLFVSCLLMLHVLVVIQFKITALSEAGYNTKKNTNYY